MAATRMRACVPAVTALAVAVLAVAPAAQTNRLGSTDVPAMLRERGIVGYANRLSVQPGETIRFMVSSELPRYRADIVRLIHGDANPNGPGLKETEIDTPVSGEYDGRRQELPFGSYVLVPDNPALRLRGSFTVTAWVAPTTPGVSFGERSAQGSSPSGPPTGRAATACSSTRAGGSRSGSAARTAPPRRCTRIRRCARGVQRFPAPPDPGPTACPPSGTSWR